MNSLIVNKEDLKHNINLIKQYSKNCKIIAIVKGNGYGLGLSEYMNFLIENGIDFFAVATVEEIVQIRENGYTGDLLMLSSTCIPEDVSTLIENNAILTIGSEEAAKLANKIALEKEMVVNAHLKIDTGFGRYGFVYSNPELIINTFNLLENINITGTYSHFSRAYYKKDKWTITQFERFNNVVSELKKNGINTGMLHICNSPAFFNFENMHLDAVRIGSAFLGRVATEENTGLKKIGFLKTTITELKVLPKDFNIGYLNLYKTKQETKIAIAPIGYKDGFNIINRNDMFRKIDTIRDMWGNVKNLFRKRENTVKINDKYYPIVGKIGMYHIDINITNSDIKVGDAVYLNVSPMYVDSKIRREYI
jgi:alanine racemase